MTFTAGLTLPGGYNGSAPNLGMAVLTKKTAFQVFLVCDTLAMYCSIIIIVALLWAQLGDISIILKAFYMALPFLGLALTSMSIAFMAGTYAAVSHGTYAAVSHSLEWSRRALVPMEFNGHMLSLGMSVQF
uniref:PGG domain-containing protein n=1 Tax=Brassica oleracea var. oleracea TaxID=109376 RepID=A0A0D3DT43_BRAOL